MSNVDRYNNTQTKTTQHNLLKLDKYIQSKNVITYNILEQHKNKLISIPNAIQLNTANPYSNHSRQTNNYTVISINKTFYNISFNDIENLNIILYT